MSVLTKILIVIVSILTLVFSAVTVAYVGSAENYKEKCVQLQSDLNGALDDYTSLRTLYDSKSLQLKSFKEDSLKEREDLIRENTDLQISLRTTETNMLEKERSLGSMVAELTALRTTIQNLETSLRNTQGELEKTRATSIKDKTELTEITETLYQRIVEMQNLEVQVKRLLEEKTILENQVSGNIPSIPDSAVITPEIGSALPIIDSPVSVAAVTGITGRVTAISGGGLAEVSVGAADGLRKNDVLHVFRGGQYVCDISITDVDTNKAAGIVEIQQAPLKIGDTASTEF